MPKNITRKRSQKKQQKGGEQKQQKQQKKQQGGKTKRKASKWNLFVKKVYQDMKKSNSNTTFSQALVKASELKKQGDM